MGRLEGVEHLGDGGSVVPGHRIGLRGIGRASGHVDAVAGGDRDKGVGHDADLLKKFAVFTLYGTEGFLGIPDQIHLVYGDNHLADPQQA